MHEGKVKETLDKIYFLPGELVKVRHDIDNKPTMVIKGKSTLVPSKNELGSVLKNPAPHFHGMICYWFSKNQEYVEKVFNTKDLIHV